jgi:small subunit ribosomal protein S6
VEVNQYETIFVCSPDFSPEKIASLTEKIKAIITKDSGAVVSVNEWGKRQLAYRISGCNEGIYVFIEHISSGGAVSAMENMLRITEGVLRYLTVRKQQPEKVSTQKKRAKAAAKAQAAKAEKPAEKPVEKPVEKPAEPKAPEVK